MWQFATILALWLWAQAALADSYTFNGSSSGNTITLSGDISGSGITAIPTTLPTINSNVGTFGSSTAIPIITANEKGQITAAGM